MTHDGIGDLEQLVLLAVVRLHGNAYAVSVRREIEARTGRTISRGAVYVTMGRLERKGYLRSKLGAPTNERGGKAKRLFEVTAAGTKIINSSLAEITAMLDGIGGRFAWPDT